MKHKFLPNTIDAMLIMSKCCQNLHDLQSAKKWLYEALNIMPNAEIVCELARLYEIEGNVANAIYLYQSALNIVQPHTDGFFVREEYYHLIPLVELTRLCYNSGNKEMAKHYHILAKQQAPNNKAVIYNQQFFNNPQD